MCSDMMRKEHVSSVSNTVKTIDLYYKRIERNSSCKRYENNVLDPRGIYYSL